MQITPLFLATFLHWVHGTWISNETRQVAWIFTSCLVIHFIGLSLLFGSMLIVDLRLLGFVPLLPIRSALKFLPIAITGFVVNLVTGTIMFTFNPVGYWLNPAFRIKVALLLLAGLNALWFTIAEHRHVLTLPDRTKTTAAVKASAALSLFVWLLVMTWGRLIVAFQASPYLFGGH